MTGSLVAREEIIVAPEIDGLRVMELKADEGDSVKKGDMLAVLVSEQLDAQIAQNEASLARANAAIAQTTSQIVEAEARLAEAKSVARARPPAGQEPIPLRKRVRSARSRRQDGSRAGCHRARTL